MRPSSCGKKCSLPGSAAPAGGASASFTRWPSPVAVAVQPASGRGIAARVAAIGAPHCGCGPALAPTGSESARSAPSGMQVSLQTSQSARAAISTRSRASAGTVSTVGSRISPSKP